MVVVPVVMLGGCEDSPGCTWGPWPTGCDARSAASGNEPRRRRQSPSSLFRADGTVKHWHSATAAVVMMQKGARQGRGRYYRLRVAHGRLLLLARTSSNQTLDRRVWWVVFVVVGVARNGQQQCRRRLEEGVDGGCRKAWNKRSRGPPNRAPISVRRREARGAPSYASRDGRAGFEGLAFWRRCCGAGEGTD